MKQKPSSRRKRYSNKSVLRLPDLDTPRVVVLNSLNSADWRISGTSRPETRELTLTLTFYWKHRTFT